MYLASVLVDLCCSLILGLGRSEFDCLKNITFGKEERKNGQKKEEKLKVLLSVPGQISTPLHTVLLLNKKTRRRKLIQIF